MSRFDLSGRAAIVTGAAGGLGRAFALAFGEAGADVLAADIAGEPALETAELARAKGGRAAVGLAVDVTDPSSLVGMAEAAMSAFGRIDVLINNAAIYAGLTRAGFREIDPAEWDRVMAVNVKGAWLATRAVAPHLTRPGGRIVNIASATVMSGSINWLHYVTSKGAVIAMTRALARELGGEGITVNAIAPGFTLTEASLSLLEDAPTYGIERGAIKRPATPEDMVGAALFLASAASDYVTGQTLVVDGGKQFI